MDTLALIIGGIVGLILFVWIWRWQTRRLAPILPFPLWRRSVVSETAAECPLPPKGWYCTRDAGHPGPCAARELARGDDSTNFPPGV